MRRFVLRMISLLIWLVVAGSTVYTQTKAPDVIIVNAKIYTVDSKFSTAEGVAITDGKFTAVGTTAQIRKLSGPSTRILDAGGKTIVPGLQDNHLHNAGGGPGVDLFNARTLEDLLDRIGARAKETKPGDDVITKHDWHEAQLKEQRLPYRKDLDKIAPKVPVVVVRGGHEYILNSAALDKWHIDKSTQQPAGGRISRDEKGELNGELVDRAKALVTLPPEPKPGPAYFLEEHEKLNAAGLTAIRYPGASIDQYRALQELNRMGWRVATHAVGDAAIDEVSAAYEAADAEKSIVGRRWTIEHAFIPRPDHFPRMKRLYLIISDQDHLYMAGPSIVKMWGPKRAAWMTPLRTYIDQGLMVSLGTDASVIPYPPLWVFYHFVTRDTISGGVLGADQKITRQEALKAQTINNAYTTFDEKTKGSIEPGKFADLVVLEQDIMTAPEKSIESMRVLATMVGGKIVYERQGFNLLAR